MPRARAVRITESTTLPAGLFAQQPFGEPDETTQPDVWSTIAEEGHLLSRHPVYPFDPLTWDDGLPTRRPERI